MIARKPDPQRSLVSASRVHPESVMLRDLAEHPQRRSGIGEEAHDKTPAVAFAIRSGAGDVLRVHAGDQSGCDVEVTPGLANLAPLHLIQTHFGKRFVRHGAAPCERRC